MAKKIGIIIGNRRHFEDSIYQSARERILKVLMELKIETVILEQNDTTKGCVSNLEEAEECARLFKSNKDDIIGILVSLPNFSDERSIANAIRWSELKVPVLIHAFRDKTDEMQRNTRKDTLWGKISVCNNLRQYGIAFTLTQKHIEDPETDIFKNDITRFIATCRVTVGMRRLRVGMIGARPALFNTVRYSEKILENNGISVETLDLSEVFNKMTELSDHDENVKLRIVEINQYLGCKTCCDDHAVLKMAKLLYIIEEYIRMQKLDIISFQCWNILHKELNISVCALLSILNNKNISAACETDVTGALAMHALVLAADGPSAIVDWNNNYGDNEDQCVFYHCSNFPKDILDDEDAANLPVIAFKSGEEAKNCYGIIEGKIKAGDFTYCRITTDDVNGCIRAYR